jgi:AcrR family transcriptional regulator
MDETREHPHHVGGGREHAHQAAGPAGPPTVFQRAQADGSRSGLDIGRMVECAISIADAEGLVALSMRRVARELGRPGVMSLYRHVQSKDDLIDLMLDQVLGEAPVVSAGDQDWRVPLRDGAIARRATMARHPWAIEASAGRALLGPHSLAQMERTLAALDGVGITLDLAFLILACVDAYTMGSVADDIARQVSWEQHSLKVERSRPDLTKAMASGAYPTLARFVTGHRHPSSDERFQFGLDRLLDGVATLLERNSGNRDRLRQD